MSKSRPRVVCASPGAKLDHVAGDATEAYPKQSGLERFVRHLLFVKPDVLIVIDDIVLDRTADLELRLHTESSDCREVDGGYLVAAGQTVLRVGLLTRDNVKMDAANLPARGSHSKGANLFTIRFTNHDARWRNAVALSWATAGAEAKRVGFSKDEQAWTFSIAGKKLLFDWEQGQAVLQR
jgi:hypothetical protein